MLLIPADNTNMGKKKKKKEEVFQNEALRATSVQSARLCRLASCQLPA